jgi:hypothetical protein
MTQFTSFVAVEEMVVTDGGQPRRIDVPVEVPEGVNRSTVFGEVSANGPINGRGLAYSGGNLAHLSPMPAVAESVMVTRAPEKSKVSNGVGGAGAGKLAAPAPTSQPSSAFVIEADKADSGRLLSAEEQKRAALQSKFHPSVLAVIARLKEPNSKPAADEVKFIHNGKAEVQIWFTEKSDEAMARLKELGFEIVLDPKTAKMVIGRLPIEKLGALAELKAIRYVAPEISN